MVEHSCIFKPSAHNLQSTSAGGSGHRSNTLSSLEEDGEDNLSLHCIFVTDLICYQ